MTSNKNRDLAKAIFEEEGSSSGWYVLSPAGERLDGPYEFQSDAATAVEEKGFEEGSYVEYQQSGLRYNVTDKSTGEINRDFDNEADAESYRLSLPDPETFVVAPNREDAMESEIVERVKALSRAI